MEEPKNIIFDEEKWTIYQNTDLEAFETEGELWQWYRQQSRELEERKLELHEHGKNLFVRTCKWLFDKYPELKSFAWTQYTPYFMDGDPCVFSADVYCFYMNGISVDGDDWNAEFFEKEDRGENLTDHPEIGGHIQTILDSFSDDDYENFFGDHALVVVNRKGVYIHDWNHD